MLLSHRSWLAAVACAMVLVVFAAPVRAIDPNHLPDDAELILTLNLKQILKSELVKANKDLVTQLKFLVDNQLADVGAQRYLERLDFDLFRDVAQVTVATNGGKIPHFLLLEGTFDAEKFNAIGEEASRDNAEHIKPVKIAGQPAFEIRINTDDQPVFAGVLGKTRLIAAGSKEGFAEAVARIGSTSAKPSKLKKELRDLLGPASAKQSLSLVTTGPALVKLLDDAPVPNIDALQELLAGVSALNIFITVEKNVVFELAVNSKDKKTAEEMAKLTGVGLAASRMMLKKRVETDPKLIPALDIVNTMRVTTQGSNFVLRGEIAGDTLAKLLKDLPK